jgi:hypothetical protein
MGRLTAAIAGTLFAFFVGVGFEVSPLEGWWWSGTAWIAAAIWGVVWSVCWARARRRLEKPLTSLEHRELERVIQGWLENHGYQLVDLEVNETEFELVMRSLGRHIQFKNTVREPRRLMIGSGIQLNPNHQQLLDSVEPTICQSRLDRLVNLLVFNVGSLGIQFGMRREEGRYRIKLVHDVVIQDDLDEYTLLQEIGKVVRGHATVNASLMSWADEIRPRSTAG